MLDRVIAAQPVFERIERRSLAKSAPDVRRGLDRRSNAGPPATVFDLGHELPIEIDGLLHTHDDHRRVSFRWLAGTALTGLSGALLIGTAIIASFGHQKSLVEQPSFALSNRDRPSGEVAIDPLRGDRLIQPIDIIAAKQTYKVPSTVKLGDKEIVTTASFTKVATPLALARLGLGREVPKFNPLNLISDNGPENLEAPPVPMVDDQEVSFRILDLDTRATPPAIELSPREIDAQLTEHIKNTIAAGSSASPALPPQLLLMRTSRVALDQAMGQALGQALGQTSGPAAARTRQGFTNAPFANITVRMVPENVSVLEKAPAPTIEAKSEEVLAIVRHNQTLPDILREAGVAKQQIATILQAFGSVARTAFHEGQQLKLQFSDAGDEINTRQLVRITVYTDQVAGAAYALNDAGTFVLQRQAAANQPSGPKSNDDGLQLYDAFYETALKQGLPKSIIQQLVHIFANDVDFLAEVSAGDSFEAFYTNPEIKKGAHELLYASITTHNEVHRYYRYHATDDNLVDYFDADGHSSRKFLIRKPIDGGRMSSPFGWRVHPILHYRKLHSGTDWAAAIGTPIVAAGNGIIIKAAMTSGYGRRVEIQHAYGYETTYNHMSGFGRGIVEGARVKQGQLIGFVGMSGLATGAHLHYEVLINGDFQDPMRVKLARTKDLQGGQLTSFRLERQRVDRLMAQAPSAGAQVASRVSQ